MMSFFIELTFEFFFEPTQPALFQFLFYIWEIELSF